jgi:hypothetical protein
MFELRCQFDGDMSANTMPHFLSNSIAEFKLAHEKRSPLRRSGLSGLVAPS